MVQANGFVDPRGYLTLFAPLVKRMANHLLTRLPVSVQVDDIIQAGMMGLMDAIGRYRADQGAQFEAYATQRIRGAMLDELRAGDWLPRRLRRTKRNIESAMSRLEQRHGRPANERELAAELGVSLEEYRAMLVDAKGYQLIHADELSGEEDGESIFDRFAADEESEPLERLKDQRFRKALVAAIERLPEREKTLMGLYYEQELNFREIAAVLGVTESRVCQVHTQAVARLRVKLRDW